MSEWRRMSRRERILFFALAVAGLASVIFLGWVGA
jgi:hypothetical protein